MNIGQPRWKVPEYSKKEINNAGNTIRDLTATEEEKQEAIKVVENWRAAHAYPLQVFYMNLRRIQGTRNDIIVAQRLKRYKSIELKLFEQPTMELWRMHDLGGCRIIFPTLEEMYKYSDKLVHSRIRHELRHSIEKYDYIKKPKISGYRSLHLVYKFHSEKEAKAVYNNNILIELQFRTHLQHIWSTALETVGLFSNQALKAGHGSEDILRFFALVSSLFAIQEGCPVVPGTVSDEIELVSEIEEINDRIHILGLLSGINVALEHEKTRQISKQGLYLLTLNYEKRRIRVVYYKPSENEKAENEKNKTNFKFISCCTYVTYISTYYGFDRFVCNESKCCNKR